MASITASSFVQNVKSYSTMPSLDSSAANLATRSILAKNAPFIATSLVCDKRCRASCVMRAPYVMAPPHCRHTAHAKLLTRNGSNTFAVSMLLYWIVNKLIPMRVSSESERIGLDMSQHGESYNFADMEDEVDDDGQLRY